MFNWRQVLAYFLLIFLTLNALGQYDHHDGINSAHNYNDMLNPIYSESPQLIRLARQIYRPRPILAGATAGVIVANNRRPTYYAPSSNYYYPSSGYTSNGCNCNG